MDSYCIKWIIISYCIYYFGTQVVPDLGSGILLNLVPVSFWCVIIILSAFPYFLAQWPRLILLLAILAVDSAIAQWSLVPFMEDGI